MVFIGEIMKKIILLLLLLSVAFAQQDIVYYSDSLITVVSLDTLTAIDTTDYAVGKETTGRKPSRIFVNACISDTLLNLAPLDESVSNTATIDVYGYSGGFWWHIVQWDATADFGCWNKYIDNFSYESIRFITRSNTGYVRIALQLIRTR